MAVALPVSRLEMLFAGLAVVVAGVPPVSRDTRRRTVTGIEMAVPDPEILIFWRRMVLPAAPEMQIRSVVDAAGTSPRKAAE